MFRRAVLAAFLLASTVSAQPKPDPSLLTLDRIFASSDFQGRPVPFIRWLDDGGYMASAPSPKVKGARDLARFDREGKKVEVILPAEKLVPPGKKDPLAIHDYKVSKKLDLVLIYTNSSRVWRRNTRGDYWIFHRGTGKLTQVGAGAKPSTLMFAKVSPDGKRVGYVRENNLYVESIDGGPATRLTSDGADSIFNGTFDWVYEEEFDCRDGWRWSPDSQQIAYWQLDSRGVKTFTLIDQTSSRYPILKTFAYPKTGERNSACRIGVIPTTGGTTRWLNVPGDTRTDYYLPRMEWAGQDSRRLVIQRINRLQNALDIWMADSQTGNVKAIHTERDGAWVGIQDDAMDWVKKGRAFTWISERDGWRRLFLISREGNTIRLVTRGNFDVIRVLKIDEKGNRVYFLASPENPTQCYLYSTPLSGKGKPRRLTPANQPGWHSYSISSDGQLAVHSYSTFGTPPSSELIRLPDHQVLRPLAANEKLRKTVEQLKKTPVEFFRVDNGNGIKLDGWLMKPANFDPKKKYPLLFHVYGEPAGQLVTDRWSGSRHLWHLMLTQQGYAVACVDNRGTPCPRGRDWRKAVYRKIGVLASSDQAAAARELLKRPYLDASRVGVWGWSGGGSMTLNLMFRSPDIYRTGMAVAPVPDMSLYDTIYQERYMGLPQDNAEDYKKGSPITHAAGLKGNLLIVHGTGDDNVHYQGTEKLVNRLIELNKPFSMMSYPNRSHSINEGKNTSRHLYGLLTRYLKEHLPAGPLPRQK